MGDNILLRRNIFQLPIFTAAPSWCGQEPGQFRVYFFSWCESSGEKRHLSRRMQNQICRKEMLYPLMPLEEIATPQANVTGNMLDCHDESWDNLKLTPHKLMNIQHCQLCHHLIITARLNCKTLSYRKCFAINRRTHFIHKISFTMKNILVRIFPSEGCGY